MSRRSEHQIADEHPEADLRKVAHHGSATSTIRCSKRCIPRFAVIGHLRQEVLSRLENSHVLTYRADLEGAVTFYLDGKAVIPGLFPAEVH